MAPRREKSVILEVVAQDFKVAQDRASGQVHDADDCP